MAEALRLNLALGPEFSQLAEARALNEGAMKTLRETLPKASKIKPTYVHAGSKKADLELPITGCTISVLGPERDIDFYYLGDEGDPSLRRALGFVTSGSVSPQDVVPAPEAVAQPSNLDAADFRNLRSRMLSTALAFALKYKLPCWGMFTYGGLDDAYVVPGPYAEL